MKHHKADAIKLNITNRKSESRIHCGDWHSGMSTTLTPSQFSLMGGDDEKKMTWHANYIITNRRDWMGTSSAGNKAVPGRLWLTQNIHLFKLNTRWQTIWLLRCDMFPNETGQLIQGIKCGVGLHCQDWITGLFWPVGDVNGEKKLEMYKILNI